MDWQMIFNLFMAIGAAQAQLKNLKPGEERTIDIPDVAFGQKGIRYDITEMTIKRAESVPK